MYGCCLLVTHVHLAHAPPELVQQDPCSWDEARTGRRGAEAVGVPSSSVLPLMLLTSNMADPPSVHLPPRLGREPG